MAELLFTSAGLRIRRVIGYLCEYRPAEISQKCPPQDAVGWKEIYVDAEETHSEKQAEPECN